MIKWDLSIVFRRDSWSLSTWERNYKSNCFDNLEQFWNLSWLLRETLLSWLPWNILSALDLLLFFSSYKSLVAKYSCLKIQTAVNSSKHAEVICADDITIVQRKSGKNKCNNTESTFLEFTATIFKRSRIYSQTGGPFIPGCKKWHVLPLRQPRFETKCRHIGAPLPRALPRARPRGIPRPLPRMFILSPSSPSSSSSPYSPPSSNWSVRKSSRWAWGNRKVNQWYVWMIFSTPTLLVY